MTISLEDGRASVALARATLEAKVKGEPVARQGIPRGVFAQPRGVFVTINTTLPVSEKLRGCIGFPYPVMPLGDAIVEATVAAASEDPRFPPVSSGELGSVVLEVSVLTPPSPIRPKNREDLPSLIRLGVDGLVVSRHGQSGLLLPQVATEFGMDQKEFLSQASLKAGLPPDSWLDPETEVRSFQAEIFAESMPGGEVERVELQGS